MHAQKIRTEGEIKTRISLLRKVEKRSNWLALAGALAAGVGIAGCTSNALIFRDRPNSIKAVEFMREDIGKLQEMRWQIKGPIVYSLVHSNFFPEVPNVTQAVNVMKMKREEFDRSITNLLGAYEAELRRLDGSNEVRDAKARISRRNEILLYVTIGGLLIAIGSKLRAVSMGDELWNLEHELHLLYGQFAKQPKPPLRVS